MQFHLESKGIDFASSLTDTQVRERLSTKRTEFAQSLYSRREWSEKQRAWAHYIVQEQPRCAFDFSPLLRMIRSAQSKGAKRITIRFKDFILKLSNDKVAVLDHETKYNPRFDAVTNIFYGYIGEDETTVTNPSVITSLKLASADPLSAAVEYGRASGSCACCGKKLTDEQSMRLGIGPVCAKKYGLA